MAYKASQVWALEAHQEPHGQIRVYALVPLRGLRSLWKGLEGLRSLPQTGPLSPQPGERLKLPPDTKL